MKFIKWFKGTPKETSANIAKERLQLIVAHQRVENNGPDFLPLMKNELIAVIAKYAKIDPEEICVELDHREDQSILELNITMPENMVAQDKKKNHQKDNSKPRHGKYRKKQQEEVL